MEKLVYSMKEVAEILGVSKSLIYDLAKRKEIPVIHIGSRIVLPAKSLEEFLDTSIEKEGYKDE